MLPTVRVGDTTYRKRTYTPDFTLNGNVHVEIKGFETDVYKLKRQLMYYQHPNIQWYEIKTLKELDKFILNYGKN